MKIAIVSTRGIPNNYGGFEQFAEYISVGLVQRGYEVIVYSPHFHPYQGDSYHGVRVKHIYSPERWLGSSVGSFFYDFLSFRDALLTERCDIIYEAGYTSIIPAYIWYNVRCVTSSIVVTNMDGLEQRRTKFHPLVRRFLEWEERMAVKHSHHLIADNIGIQQYYKSKYGVDSKYLAYGADIHHDFSQEALAPYGVTAKNYYLLIARLEPENNIVVAIEGYLASAEYGKRPLLIVGKTNTPHGKDLVKRYGQYEHVHFLGGIYDFTVLDALRHYSYAYFHGHSVGGTNPSLLEAMAAQCLILAADNIFNRGVLDNNALYYSSSSEVTQHLNSITSIVNHKRQQFITNNTAKIRHEYSWQHLIAEHDSYFRALLAARK